MSEFDFDHAYEVCPHCEEEVMLDPGLLVQLTRFGTELAII